MTEGKPKQFSAGPLTWTDASLWAQFDGHHTASPNAVAAYDSKDRKWTRAELRAMALQIAAALRNGGVREHERVLLRATKDPSSLAAALAISSVGAIVCPMAPDLGLGERRALEERLGHAALLDSAISEGAEIAGANGLRIALTDRASVSRDERNASTGLIGFTSGTTGIPKGVMHSYAALNYVARASVYVAGVKPSDAVIGIMPFGSAPGYAFNIHFALSLGNPLVLVDPWNPARCLEQVQTYSCAWGMCVPTPVNGMIEAARTGAWSKGKLPLTLFVGGSAMTPELVSSAEELLGITVLRTFGMSECMGHATTFPSDTLERRLYSDGKSFPGTSDEAFDNDLHILPRGQQGQAGVRGPSLLIGYCKGMGDDGYKLTADGYFLTGDEIVCDKDNYVRVAGRIKDLIIRGGYNINPAEVEAALLQHPAIAKVAVVAVPDPKLGERACAMCCIREGFEAPDLAGLISHLESLGLSKRKWPEYMLVVDDLELNVNAKVNKKSMAKRAAAELGLDRPGG